VNVARQKFTKSEIRVEDSSGRVFVLTRADVKALFAAQTGTLAQRKSKTLLAIRDLAHAALPDCGFKDDPAIRWTIDFDRGDDDSFAALEWERLDA